LRYLAIGYDDIGRLLEMCAVFDDGHWLVFHAMPATTRFYVSWMILEVRYEHFGRTVEELGGSIGRPPYLSPAMASALVMPLMKPHLRSSNLNFLSPTIGRQGRFPVHQPLRQRPHENIPTTRVDRRIPRIL